jgi:hypothetical protein
VPAQLYTLYNNNSSIFHDITVGNISVPCSAGSADCADDSAGDYFEEGYNTTTGYDLATGLGSVDAAKLVADWVPLASPTLTVTAATPNPATTVQTIQVPVSVSGSSGTPTGRVTLTGGGFTSEEQLLTNGSTVFNIPGNSLNAGTDTLTVIYSGDSTYQSGSGRSAVTVTGSTYALSATAPAAVASGSSTSSSVTVTGSGSYVGTVSLTCALTAYPSGARTGDLPTCTGGQAVTLNPASGWTTVTVNLQVSTTAPASGELVRPKLGKGQGWAGGGAALAFLVFLGIPARRRSWQSMLGVLVAMVVLGSMAGCVNTLNVRSDTASPASSGTTAGSYTFTVTAIGNPSVTPTPTTTFTVVVN